MKENTKEYLFSLLQKKTPFLLALFFILLEYAAHNFLRLEIRPMLGMAAVFFWLFNRPDIFNLWSVAMLGIICDLLSFSPTGLYLFSFLLMYVLEMKIAKYFSNKLFAVNFLFFALLLLVVIISEWLVMTIYYKTAMPFLLLFISWVLTVCLYPLIADINLRAAKNILPEEDF